MPALTLRPDRRKAHEWVDKAPDGWVLSVAEAKRTDPQNRKMWAMLGDIARAKLLGRDYTPDMWKAAFMRSLGYEVEFLLDLDGKPFPYALRSSRLTRGQMAELLALIQATGDAHDVQWTNDSL